MDQSLIKIKMDMNAAIPTPRNTQHNDSLSSRLDYWLPQSTILKRKET